MKTLEGRICLVAGATRGAGRAIACTLGEAGATVYCTGRSTRAQSERGQGPGPILELARRPETIEETAELVTARGGRGIAVRVDHTDVDGRKPDWGAYFRETYGRSYPVADERAYASWSDGPLDIAYPDFIKD